KVSSWWVLAGCVGSAPDACAERRGALPVMCGCLARPIDPAPDAGTAAEVCFWMARACGRARADTLLFRLSCQVADPHCVTLPSLPSSTVGAADQPWEAFDDTS